MIIYNQTSTAKRFLSGILIGVLVLPAIWLLAEGFMLYGLALVIIYLAFETHRTGVHFDFVEGKLSAFREVFFIKIPKGAVSQLNAFNYYRIVEEHKEATISANWVQSSTISQTHQILELFNTHNGEFEQIVKSNSEQLKPLLDRLEERDISLYQLIG